MREILAGAWDEVAIRSGQLGEVVRETFGGTERARLLRWLSLPLAAAAVIAALLLIQGGAADPVATASAPEAPTAGAGGARFVEQPGYSLALPDGWTRVAPPSSAVFAAQAADGQADATLWIERDGSLSMRDFEKRSLAQLADLGGPHVVDRVVAPTIEGTIVELAADGPAEGSAPGSYRVTLRGAGPFRYYLSTSVDPGAPAALSGDVELIHGSLRPDLSTDPGEGSR